MKTTLDSDKLRDIINGLTRTDLKILAREMVTPIGKSKINTVSNICARFEQGTARLKYSLTISVDDASTPGWQRIVMMKSFKINS